MLDLLALQDRSLLARSIREQVAAGDVGAATSAIERHVEQSGDPLLMEAARTATVRLDWGLFCAEAIEADAQLRAKGEPGCRYVVLDLGNLRERRLQVIRHYHAPDATPGQARKGRPVSGIGGYHAVLYEPPVEVAGLERLARLQLSAFPMGRRAQEQQAHQRRTMLAGHLLVLRFLGAVRLQAAEQGFPFPVHLEAGVESITGEDAIRQLEPSLSLAVQCAVGPVSAEAEARLAERHRMHVEKWHEHTERLVANVRAHFREHGYVPSRWLPDELGETKRRLRTLEERLMLFHPALRMTRRDAEALALEVREIRDATPPRPVDLTHYR